MPTFRSGWNLKAAPCISPQNSILQLLPLPWQRDAEQEENRRVEEGYTALQLRWGGRDPENNSNYPQSLPPHNADKEHGPEFRAWEKGPKPKDGGGKP